MYLNLTQAIWHLRTNSRNKHKPLFSWVGALILYLCWLTYVLVQLEILAGWNLYTPREAKTSISLSQGTKYNPKAKQKEFRKSRKVTFCSAEDFLHKPVPGHRKDRFAEMSMGEIQVAYFQAYSAFWHCLEHPRHPHGLANICGITLPGYLYPSGYRPHRLLHSTWGNIR